MTTKPIQEEPPEPESKYMPTFEAACRTPRTFYRFPQSFKSYASGTYLRQNYSDKFPGFHMEFKTTKINGEVWIYVAAFPV